MSAYDPKRTLAVHSGDGFDAGFQPLSKYSIKPIRCRLLGLGTDMRRREFITLLGGAFAIVPGAAFAQTDRIRLVGLLLSQFEGSQEAKDRIAAVREGLQKLGWTEGRNIRIEAHYANGSADRMRAHAAELVQ
jgi:hypothetical protein